MGLSRELARDLLAIKAVQIKTDDYFTWTSGIKSPIYCDNRLTMSCPSVRKKITEAFVRKIEEMEEKPDVIAGCATAGIPHAAWLADRLNLPMIYVRSTPKGHGKGNQVEGEIQKGQKVLVIEDLISTGGSAIDTGKTLQQLEAEVIGVLAIFTYGLAKSKENFSESAMTLQTLTSFDQLIDVLVKDEEVSNLEKIELLDWRDAL